MAGTLEGGKKAAATNKLTYGNQFYVSLGRKGVSVTGVKKGFAANPELAKIAGAKGGSISRKTKEVVEPRARGWFARLLSLFAI